jgi:ATP-grasp domain, R2K clade family 3
MRFVFPSNYFKPKQVDEAYSEEFGCLRDIGWETSVISIESLSLGTSNIFPIPKLGEKLVYRGWMLTPDEYFLLVAAVENAGVEMWISTDEYRSNHYLPNWYSLISDLTPETHLFSVNDDLERGLNGLGWSRFFIKDYVKSLKTSVGSIINKPSEISTVIAEMQKFRGTIEGGICVRQVEDFIPETERRYFVINGQCFAPSTDEEIPSIVYECARRIDRKFFSVDVIDRKDCRKRIVEIGDGQVSGLVGWNAAHFATLWAD